ncbi:MAG: hypothetical protein ACYDG4_13515, partial [Desulfuromonadaceae bacterium]
MIICDRCQSPAVDRIDFQMDDQRFDLCASCRQVVLEAITAKPAPEKEIEIKPSDTPLTAD